MMNCQGKAECVGEILSSPSLYRTNPLWTTLRLNPDVRRKMPVDNRLSEVTIVIDWVQHS